MKRHKLAAFHVRFIEIPVLECGVVSQQCNGMQYTSPNSGMLHGRWYASCIHTGGLSCHTVGFSF